MESNVYLSHYWMTYLISVSNNPKITIWHLTILIAVARLGLNQKSAKSIVITRKLLMKHSNIKSIPTYHKYMKELVKFGIIIYIPSYHPSGKSIIQIL